MNRQPTPYDTARSEERAQAAAGPLGPTVSFHRRDLVGEQLLNRDAHGYWRVRTDESEGETW